MRIKRDERAGRVAVHREQFRGFEAAEAEFPIVVGQPVERFGEAGDGFAPQGREAAGVGGPVEQAHEPQHGHCSFPVFLRLSFALAEKTAKPRSKASWLKPIHIRIQNTEGVSAADLIVGFLELHAVALADVAEGSRFADIGGR